MQLKVWEDVNESDLPSVVEQLKSSINKPCAIILSGPVGAGKTTLTKEFITEDDGVCSPTYSIINESGSYAHADFYRLESPEEVVHLELSLYLEDKDYFLIEWGREFVKEIQRNIDHDWSLYELDISINPKKSENETTSSRRLVLSEIK
ncbi:tRNA (adenosine(37)-N6)-threonylcarbamoyltransferase complex ATPase subunit type 1 TsaE [Halobacteriovorax sp. HLS]|uniref:tRNA (adenosine(37)-N6)-threonylcarbamoyltransferase complex ATPase subunit type 1 TsaE n=1 Tax=Halobacteriovorax sp. HLS TaxID=2234000 RepID=UPI000FDA855D|nr:tRNA (adenosine(37)-N6)-threonylcarbamoyltransferase complex ATPase subunit type 1 TsaE [Halobacteriovorax sp. HLS]